MRAGYRRGEGLKICRGKEVSEQLLKKPGNQAELDSVLERNKKEMMKEPESIKAIESTTLKEMREDRNVEGEGSKEGDRIMLGGEGSRVEGETGTAVRRKGQKENRIEGQCIGERMQVDHENL